MHIIIIPIPSAKLLGEQLFLGKNPPSHKKSRLLNSSTDRKCCAQQPQPTKTITKKSNVLKKSITKNIVNYYCTLKIRLNMLSQSTRRVSALLFRRLASSSSASSTDSSSSSNFGAKTTHFGYDTVTEEEKANRGLY